MKRDRAKDARAFAQRAATALGGDLDKLALLCDLLEERTRHRMTKRDWESLVASGMEALR